jgi:hypothetical protein
MQLNEMIDKSGVEQVSSITNISIDNLNNLAEENFEKLTRVKSLGFLLILEREYRNDIDVSQLRERVKSYFEEHKPADENVVMVSKDSVEGGNGVSIFKWSVVFLLFLGGWLLFTQGKLDGVLKNMEDKKDFFDDNRALESNVTDKEAKNVLIEISNKEPVTIAMPVAPVEKKISLIGEEAKNDENSTRLANKRDHNGSLEPTTESIVQEVVDSAEKVVEKTVEEVVSNAHENKDNKAQNDASISTITINPTRGTLWFGFINIDTKKRREFMKKSSTPFDIKGGRWLLVTGHGYVDIVSDIESIELTDRKKHYFYIDTKEIKTLTKKEFRSMNGRRGW